MPEASVFYINHSFQISVLTPREIRVWMVAFSFSEEELRKYYQSYKPTEYLFEGQKAGKYSSRSAAQMLKRVVKKAKLIIFDDFGLQPISHQVKLILLQVLEGRYEKLLSLSIHNFLSENGMNILMNQPLLRPYLTE